MGSGSGVFREIIPVYSYDTHEYTLCAKFSVTECQSWRYIWVSLCSKGLKYVILLRKLTAFGGSKKLSTVCISQRL